MSVSTARRRHAVSRVASAVAPALFLAAGLFFSTEAAAQGGPLPVTVSAPLVQTITDWDEYTGRFEAVERVEIRARVSGFPGNRSFPGRGDRAEERSAVPDRPTPVRGRTRRRARRAFPRQRATGTGRKGIGAGRAAGPAAHHLAGSGGRTARGARLRDCRCRTGPRQPADRRVGPGIHPSRRAVYGPCFRLSRRCRNPDLRRDGPVDPADDDCVARSHPLHLRCVGGGVPEVRPPAAQ